MDHYIKRIADKIIKERLESIGAILIEGPKWCGKTTTGKYLSNSIIEMDRPDLAKQYRDMAEVNPSNLLQGDIPHMIDEWQLAPNLWNAVRYEVDQRDAFGQFILTGSSTPVKTDPSQHSGTGRIGRYRMRPMSLFESGDSSGEVSLTDLFQGTDISGIDSHDLYTIAYFICRGGWPKAIGVTEKIALRQAFHYFDAIVNYDLNRVDDNKKDSERTKRLLKSYARNIAQQTSLESIREDMIVNDTESFNKATLYSYLDSLKRIFVIEDSPAWNPNLRSKTAIRTTDTRYFVDPSIACAALGLGPDDLVNDLRTMGFIFENLCIRDLRIYSDSLDGQVYHYRDKNGLECDAVIHLRNGNYGLIEIKLGGDKAIEEAAKSLKALAGKIDTAKMKKPSFLMVLCGIAPFAYRRSDGVHVVPVCCLKD